MKASRKRSFCAGSRTSRRTAAGAGAELVDLVEHEDGVSGARRCRNSRRTEPGWASRHVRLWPRSSVSSWSPPQASFTNPRPSASAVHLASEVLPVPGGPVKHSTAPEPDGVRRRHGQVLEEARLGVAEARVPGIERRPDAGEVDRGRRTPVPGQRFQPLDPVVGLLGAGLRLVAQAAALARDGVPHGRRQPVGGALAQHVPHDGRRDHLGRSRPRRPARQRLPADQGQLRVELRHGRGVVDGGVRGRRPLRARRGPTPRARTPPSARRGRRPARRRRETAAPAPGTRPRPPRRPRTGASAGTAPR